MLADWGVSIRRACEVLPFDTSSHHYKSRRTDPAILKKRIKAICEAHVRYGCRRVYHILRREDWVVNAKKVYRIYRELGLQLRNKTPKQRVKAKLREDRAPAGSAQRRVGDGLRSRPARHGPEAAHPGGGRYLLAVLAGDRRAVQLPRRGRGRDA